MTLEEEVFKRCSFDNDKLLEYGFIKKDNIYYYEKSFHNNEFVAKLEVINNNIIGKVIELSFNEEYNNIRVKDIVGDYVNSIKSEYINILNDIKDKCTNKKYFVFDQSNRIINYVNNKYSVEPEFLWDDEENATLRHNDTKKWFGIIMYIERNKVDKSDDSNKIEVINIKLNEEVINELLKINGYYSAYHMNKKSWISIILDDTLDDKTVIKLIDDSYNNTEDIRSWIIPANPKIYDVIEYIKGKDIIDWPIKRGILVNDIVYIYYTKPYGSLLFKGIIDNINKDYMKIKILKRYKKGDYPIEVLKVLGINSVRCTRRVTKEFIDYMDID